MPQEKYIRARLIALALGLSLANFASAEPKRHVIQIATVGGKCIKFIAEGHDLTSICKPHVASIEYNDGWLSFSYAAGRDLVLTFSGDGRKQVHTTPDDAVLPIEMISSALMGISSKPDTAVGACHFSNPYKAKSVAYNCSVDTQGGHDEVEFMTDGSEPAVIPTQK